MSFTSTLKTSQAYTQYETDKNQELITKALHQHLQKHYHYTKTLKKLTIAHSEPAWFNATPAYPSMWHSIHITYLHQNNIDQIALIIPLNNTIRIETYHKTTTQTDLTITHTNQQDHHTADPELIPKLIQEIDKQYHHHLQQDYPEISIHNGEIIPLKYLPLHTNKWPQNPS